MFNTMTWVKTVGALCGALLIFMLGGWFAETIYHSGGGHGEEGHAEGYAIEVAEAGGAEEAAPAEEAVPFAEILASADPANGEKIFRKCSSCHSLEQGKNGVGPYLTGVVGRTMDTAEGYAYSGALEKVAQTWTPENLDHFLTKPAQFAPGTAMGFAGLPKVQDRADLVAYLASTAN